MAIIFSPALVLFSLCPGKAQVKVTEEAKQSSALSMAKGKLNDSISYEIPLINGQTNGIALYYLHGKKYIHALIRPDSFPDIKKQDILRFKNELLPYLAVNSDTTVLPQKITLFSDSSTMYGEGQVYDAFKFKTTSEGYLYWSIKDFTEISEWSVMPVEPDSAFSAFFGSGMTMITVGDNKLLQQVTKKTLRPNTEYIIWLATKKEDIQPGNNGLDFIVTINIADEDTRKKGLKGIFKN